MLPDCRPVSYGVLYEKPDKMAAGGLSLKFIVNLMDIYCNLNGAAALWPSIVMTPIVNPDDAHLPCHRSQLSRQEPRSSRPGLRFRAGGSAPMRLATVGRFRGAATPRAQAGRS